MQAILISNFVQDVSGVRPSRVALPQPEPDQYLIRVTHISPQHADILHANGTHQNVNAKRGNVRLPFVVGYDFAGVVAQIPQHGSSQYFPKGTRVFGSAIGAFAEFVAADAPAIQKIPDNLSSTAACACVGQAVSYAAVARLAQVQPGQTVLVSGASGGLGSFCALIAKALGAKVIALTSDSEKVKPIQKMLGVDHVVLTKGDWISQVVKISGGEGVDAVLDNTGMVEDGLRCMRNGGTLVILGFSARNGVMESMTMNRILLKSAKVIGYRHGEASRRDPAELARVWSGYLELLQSGQLKPTLFGDYQGLGDVGRAFGDLHRHKVLGKIVIPLDARRAAKL